MAFDPVASQSELFNLEQPGAAPPKNPGFDRAKLMRLIPLVAAAAKGGPGAIEGLLQGYQQAEAQKQQQAQQQASTQRQSMLDQSLLQDRAFNQDMKVADLATQQANARAKLMEAFTSATGELDNADDVRAVAAQYEQQGRSLGMRPGTFEHQAMIRLTPSTLERKAAEKKITALKSQFGVEKWMEQGAKFTHVVNGRTVPFAELLSMAGMTPDPNAQAAPQSAIAADIPLDRQHAMAVAAGNEALAKQIEEAMRRQDATRRDPPRTPISLQIGAGGMTTQQNAVFQQIVGAYERSPLVRAADRTIVLDQAIKQIEKNPSDPAAQLNLAYSYIQALDTYQSAVREGELQNLGVLGTRLQQFALELNRVASDGAFLPPEVAKNIAQNAKTLVNTIKAGSESKRQEFRSRAQVSGVGEPWDQFVAGASGGGAPGGRPAAPGGNPFRK